jgi:hypothetical protein
MQRYSSWSRLKQWAALYAIPALVASVVTPGCGHEPGIESGAAELRAFLEGAAPAPETPEDADLLNEAFARQAVRGGGYRREGVEGASEDGWSPVVKERAGEGEAAADVRPWVSAGDINEAGRFAPLAGLCPEAAQIPLTADGLSPEELDLSGLEDRMARLSCATSRLAGGGAAGVQVAWAARGAPLSAGIVISEDGLTARANPRLLHLIPFNESAAAVPPPAIPPPPSGGEALAASPGGEGSGASASANGSAKNANDGPPPLENHPRPKPEYDAPRGGCGSCNDPFDCDAGRNCNLGSCSMTSRRGDLNALLVSSLFVSALVLRRSRSRSRSRDRAERPDSAARRFGRALARRVSSLLLLAVCLALAASASAQQPQRSKRVPVRIEVTPSQAVITMDGKPLPAGPSGAVEIDPGKHTFAASLDGYDPAEQTVTVQPGAKDTAVSLKLTPNKAFVTIRAPDQGFYIAIDGAVVGQGSWSGLVAPGRRLIQVYRPGGAAYHYPVDAVAGQSFTVPSAAAPAAPPAAQPPPPSSYPERPADAGAVPPFHPVPAPNPQVRGFYVLGLASLLWQTGVPYGFEHEGEAAPGFTFGARGGYRINNVAGVEFLVEYGRIANSGVLVQAQNTDRDGDGNVFDAEAAIDRSPADYILQSFRFGPVFRMTSSGPVHRFVGGLGIGALYEIIDLDHVNMEWSDAQVRYIKNGFYHHDYSGFSPFILLEGGYERSIGNLLIGGRLQIAMESVAGLEGEPYDSTFQARFGLGLHVGYSMWKKDEERAR